MTLDLEMIFRNKHRERLEIIPVGWDPAEEWVIVKIKGLEENGSWEGRDPSLMHKEALKLTEWLESLNPNDNTSLTFIEPELEFHHKDGILNINLEYRYRPPWNQTDLDTEEKYYLSFEVTSEELKKQARNWKKNINNICKQ